jgi:hypothetical protein
LVIAIKNTENPPPPTGAENRIMRHPKTTIRKQATIVKVCIELWLVI